MLVNIGEDTMHCVLRTANALNIAVCRADNNQGGAAGAAGTNPAVVNNNNNNSEFLSLDQR